jgi:hypothetical protein
MSTVEASRSAQIGSAQPKYDLFLPCISKNMRRRSCDDVCRPPGQGPAVPCDSSGCLADGGRRPPLPAQRVRRIVDVIFLVTRLSPYYDRS